MAPGKSELGHRDADIKSHYVKHHHPTQLNDSTCQTLGKGAQGPAEQLATQGKGRQHQEVTPDRLLTQPNTRARLWSLPIRCSQETGLPPHDGESRRRRQQTQRRHETRHLGACPHAGSEMQPALFVEMGPVAAAHKHSTAPFRSPAHMLHLSFEL